MQDEAADAHQAMQDLRVGCRQEDKGRPPVLNDLALFSTRQIGEHVLCLDAFSRFATQLRSLFCGRCMHESASLVYQSGPGRASPPFA